MIPNLTGIILFLHVIFEKSFRKKTNKKMPDQILAQWSTCFF